MKRCPSHSREYMHGMSKPQCEHIASTTIRCIEMISTMLILLYSLTLSVPTVPSFTFTPTGMFALIFLLMCVVYFMYLASHLLECFLSSSDNPKMKLHSFSLKYWWELIFTVQLFMVIYITGSQPGVLIPTIGRYSFTGGRKAFSILRGVRKLLYTYTAGIYSRISFISVKKT